MLWLAGRDLQCKHAPNAQPPWLRLRPFSAALAGHLNMAWQTYNENRDGFLAAELFKPSQCPAPDPTVNQSHQHQTHPSPCVAAGPSLPSAMQSGLPSDSAGLAGRSRPHIRLPVSATHSAYTTSTVASRRLSESSVGWAPRAGTPR